MGKDRCQFVGEVVDRGIWKGGGRLVGNILRYTDGKFAAGHTVQEHRWRCRLVEDFYHALSGFVLLVLVSMVSLASVTHEASKALSVANSQEFLRAGKGFTRRSAREKGTYF